ncbi:hypothetical protein FGL91_14870 [Microbacterium sp. CBA3102]|uniref:hypothetical protein n=1 Tax=Microbacterium sp. CBA3102 TaxID=2603598 RepID=UPI0011BBA285|nr:hypothetical protein [Microbacterium sp. CBA3102]QEA29719.1 hypothetical protein FGL91_14870 [Microbacterium sp. CBA3102]
MTGLACLFGIHAPALTRILNVDEAEGKHVLTLRRVWACSRCGVRISEEVATVAELPESDD